MEKVLKWFINIILIIIIIYYLYPIGEKAVNSYENKQTYKQALEEKEELKETKDSDWIIIPGTNINYPIMWKEQDNSYYLSHDIYGNESSHGAIFYDGSREPYSEHVTILYGHCMIDKSMFATLHYFREDESKFRESELTIERKDGSVNKYKPLGVYVTNDNFFYTKLHKMSLDEGVQMIQENSKYDIDAEYDEDAEIIVLMTCSYENEGDRLFVFYISE